MGSPQQRNPTSNNALKTKNPKRIQSLAAASSNAPFSQRRCCAEIQVQEIVPEVCVIA